MRRKLLGIVIMLCVVTPALGLEVGDAAPCVVLEDIQVNGSVIKQCLRTPLKKGQFVILDFFIPKCEDCIENLPILAALAGDVATRATTRLVGVDRDKGALLDFLEEHEAHVRFPASLDTKLDAKKAYGVNAVPTVFVLNAKNRIVFKHIGVLSAEDVESIRRVVSQ